MDSIKIYLIPLTKGNFNKSKFVKQIHYCCDYYPENSTTFKDIFDHPIISERLQHISDIQNMVSVHDCIYKGTYSVMKNINDKIASYKKLYIVYPSIEDINSIRYPPVIERELEKTPLIFLDIDGIINEPFPYKQKLTKVQVMRNFKTLSIKYNPEKIRKINEWAKYAEVRFLTAWGNFATYRVAPAVGLYSFPHNYTTKDKIQNLSEEDSKRLIIWIDDEIGGENPRPNNFKDAANKISNLHIMYIPLYLQPYHFDYIQSLINPTSCNSDPITLLNTYIDSYKSMERNVTDEDILIILNNFEKLFKILNQTP